MNARRERATPIYSTNFDISWPLLAQCLAERRDSVKSDGKARGREGKSSD